MKPRVLTFHLKKEYFDAIRAGTKVFEYRKTTLYWEKRIKDREFDQICIQLGYPAKDNKEKNLFFPWREYEIQKIIHRQFGPDPVEVFAIPLRKGDDDENSCD